MTVDPVAASALMRQVPLDALKEPFYVGSVQRLYAIPDEPDYMITETTAGGSVFDVGTIFSIDGSDVARATFRHVFYSSLAKPETWQAVEAAINADREMPGSLREQLLNGILPRLVESGAKTHHEGMVDAVNGKVATDGLPENDSPFNIVRRYTIKKPEPARFFGQRVFDYTGYEGADRYVVPLECIVRFGVTSSSSVFKKYAKLSDPERRKFESELGAAKPLEAWQYLAAPIVDFTSKYEPEDRAVTKQEALNMSGLDAAKFAEMGELAVLGAWALRVIVESMGLQLWDLKWEFASDGEDLVFVDTIDTDSFRATAVLEDAGDRFAIHYNKQAMRDYYRIAHSEWLDAVNGAKAEANAAGTPFVEILRAAQDSGAAPADPRVEAEFIAIQEDKMAAVKDAILGRRNGSEVREALEACGRRELAYYFGRGHREALKQINGID